MEGEWPLLGRAAELARVDRLLGGGGGGVVLAGPAGVGKTRLAGECLARAAARGFVPLRVAATQAASALPFGAYAALLPDLAPGVERTEVLRQVSRAVTARGEGRPVALLVDDAHVLDDASAALTHQLAGSQDTFVSLPSAPGKRRRTPSSPCGRTAWRSVWSSCPSLRPRWRSS